MKNKTTNEMEGLVSPYLELDMEALYNIGTASSVTQETMDGIGLTDEAIDALLECRYCKVRNIGSRDVFEYSGYENPTYTYLFFRQGDGFDIMTAHSLRKNKTTGIWSITLNEI